MSQYRVGIVSVTQNSNIVVGQGTQWLTHVVQGASFKVIVDDTDYSVESIEDDTHLTLSSPYLGASQSGAEYAITLHFTPRFRLPEISPRDLNAAYNITKAFRILDAVIGITVANLATVTDPEENAAVSSDVVNNYRGVVITLTQEANSQAIASPSSPVDGQQFIVINEEDSLFEVTVNDIRLSPKQSVAFVWGGDGWVPQINIIDGGEWNT